MFHLSKRNIKLISFQIKLWICVKFANFKISKLRYLLHNKKPLSYANNRSKKVFCILEQGNNINNNLTKKRKKIFTTEFSDLKRLNWANNKNDNLADFYTKNMCWSEGRSFLYEKLKNKYDFYIFIDDDVDINLVNSGKEDIAYKLKNELINNNLIHGSIPNNAWLNFEKNNYGDVFPMKGGDLCVQIFRSDFAELMFPTWIHGSGKSMWYAQFIAHILFPNQSIYLNKFRANNTRHDPHMDRSLISYSAPDELTKIFCNQLSHWSLKKLFTYWREYSLSNYFLDFPKYYSYEIKGDIFNGLLKKKNKL